MNPMTRRESRESFDKMSKEAFKDHVLTVEQGTGPVRMWCCGEPGTSSYMFRVIAAPGALVIYGDVGDSIFVAHDKDLIPWLRGAIKSPDYVLSKMVHSIDKREFMEGEVEDMFARMLEYAGYDPSLTGEEAEEQKEDTYIQRAQRIIEDTKESWNHDYDDSSGHAFCEAFYNAGGDSEMLDSLFDYNANALWALGCLKKFVELLDKQDADEHNSTV